MYFRIMKGFVQFYGFCCFPAAKYHQNLFKYITIFNVLSKNVIILYEILKLNFLKRYCIREITPTIKVIRRSA